MIDAVRFERVRLTTLRSTRWLIALAIVLTAVIVGLFAWFTRADDINPDTASHVLTGFSALSPLPLTAVFMAIVGIFAAGHEYRYGTIQPTLTAVPRRGLLMVAKILVVALTAVAVAVASMVVNWVVASVLSGDALTVDAAITDDVLGFLALTTGWALLGLGLAFLLRGVPSALVIIFVTPLVVEPLIAALSNVPALDWLGGIVPYLPFAAGQRMLGTSQAFVDTDLGRWGSGAVFGVLITLVLAVAWVLFRRRDA